MEYACTHNQPLLSHPFLRANSSRFQRRDLGFERSQPICKGWSHRDRFRLDRGQEALPIKKAARGGLSELIVDRLQAVGWLPLAFLIPGNDVDDVAGRYDPFADQAAGRRRAKGGCRGHSAPAPRADIQARKRWDLGRPIDKSVSAFLGRAMCAAVNNLALLDAMPDDPATTMGACRSKLLDRAFKAVEGMGFPAHVHFENLVVVIAALIKFLPPESHPAPPPKAVRGYNP